MFSPHFQSQGYLESLLPFRTCHPEGANEWWFMLQMLKRLKDLIPMELQAP